MKQGKDGWLELDPQADMLSNTLAAYSTYKELYRKAQAARQEYERAMIAQAGLGEGKTLVFGYNFGKASIKVVEANERWAKAQAKPTQSLADFLRNAGLSGERA